MPKTETAPVITHRAHNTSARGLRQGDRIIEGVSAPIIEGFGTVKGIKMLAPETKLMLVLVRASDDSEGWTAFYTHQVLAVESPIAA